jgi:hypothetical protein
MRRNRRSFLRSSAGILPTLFSLDALSAGTHGNASVYRGPKLKITAGWRRAKLCVSTNPVYCPGHAYLQTPFLPWPVAVYHL